MLKTLNAASSQLNLTSLGCLEQLGTRLAILDPYH
jgi:hypothetical protein